MTEVISPADLASATIDRVRLDNGTERALAEWPQDCRLLVVGDSHAQFWTGQEMLSAVDLLPGVKTHRIGPQLAFNLSNTDEPSGGGAKVLYLLDKMDERYGLPEFIMFCFGEIDIRTHIVRRAARSGIPLDQAVKIVVDRYLVFLRVAQRYDRRILVWGPPAAQWDGARIDPNYPTAGTEQERNLATILFYHFLRQAADENPGLFTLVGILPELMLPGYRTQRGFFCDTIHLGRAAMPLALLALEEATGWRPAWTMPEPKIISASSAHPVVGNLAPGARWRITPSNEEPLAAITAEDPSKRTPARTPLSRNPKCHFDLLTDRTVREVRIQFASEADAQDYDKIKLTFGQSGQRHAFAAVEATTMTANNDWRIYTFENFECRHLRIEKFGEDVRLEICGVEIIGVFYPLDPAELLG
ncbi:hypothetical protein IHQ68_00590 [Chelatococcus sambhunathii]|uniref:SGNH hydrolase-type esterase domain-containing protein n=1 Tax=Chelatococcus sambhunathii TaxID=363953 RepID=A0ABU1DAP0_9HYPH|nr:hypothetical protein [Chelatococcus sambhunathii]MDR4305125.1 hypothetical protein [Chelatococcus sambhunathii]